jgi:hypothetical protein
VVDPNDNVRQDKVEQGRELIREGTAQGQPGEKQPPHPSAQDILERAPEYLKLSQNDVTLKAKDSSAARSQRPGNDYPVPPQDRKPDPTGQTSLAVTAASALAAAANAASVDATTEARLASDPRRQRDLRLLEVQQQGKTALIPPHPAEVAANLQRAGVSPEVAELIPKTPEEQVAQDMPRLEEAANALPPVAQPGEDQIEGVNNLDRMRNEGANVGGDSLRPPEEETEAPKKDFVIQ